MNNKIYNVPAVLASQYGGRRKIVRLQNSVDVETVRSLADPDSVVCFQLPVSMGNTELLSELSHPLKPLDILLARPDEEFPLLYEYSRFASAASIRATIPVLPGLSKAVRAAASLHFEVKLEHEHAAHDAADELLEVLHFYLHNPTVSQPVEYFHGVLMSMIHGGEVSLWEIQEEDPAQFRYLTDGGQERISSRLAEIGLPADPDTFVERLSHRLSLENERCSACDFFSICRGWLKCPDETYDCTGHQAALRTLQGAAEELKADLRGA